MAPKPKKGSAGDAFQKALEDFAKQNPQGEYKDLRVELVVDSKGGTKDGRVTEYRIAPPPS